jgi:hypothetical protein
LDADLACFDGLAMAAAAVELGALPKKLEMSRCFMAGDQTTLIAVNNACKIILPLVIRAAVATT